MMKKIVMMMAGALLVSTAAVQADGKKIYTEKCSACHASGVAGAPKSHNKDDWAPRLANGIDALLASAKKGKNAMPPMGTCMDCSDADLKSAIEYMSSAK